ncbi:glycoside hydrolase family 31 protein [Paraflavitalea pollutisoli]|uniref:glycoside hydrolase family 31 protein n=1 Tax=Paraflavitalea pollutisoli TaxID=3034143 RepID=UPI0023EBF652|nr:TIM-barrel domain-containing protein [Paraflavitalea sp. H1-2-19X]
MFTRILLVCLLLASYQILSAQTGIGTLQGSYTKNGNSVQFKTSTAQLRLEFCTPAMVRIRSSWTGSFEANESLMVVQYAWPSVAVQVKIQADHFLVTTAQLQLRVYKSPARIDIYTAAGKLLSSEKVTTAKGGLFRNADTVGCTKQCQPDEQFFGFGERMDFLNRRSKKLTLNVGRGKGLPHAVGAYNILEANYSPVPFFLSTQGYGIFFHNSFATSWDMGATRDDEYRFAAAGGELDYYFIYGPRFPALLEQYTALTGRSPLLPRFALGLHVGTYSGGTWGHEQLTSDRYVIELARKLRAMGIPVDLLWLDSTWRIFGKNGGKGATSFEWRETFADPKGMFDSLYAMGYNMVGLHLRPRFDNGNKIRLLDTAQQLGFTYREGNYAGEFVNYFDSNAVNFWWQRGVMRVASIGARFLKTDEGSAFGHLANESDKTGPTGKAIEGLHNVFPIAYAKAPYEKFQQYNGVRGLNQTREGYAGIQRYPYIFAGDWPSEWQYFPAVIKAGLNIGLSGVGYWAHCMGGFEHNADPELYIRWCQFGMLSPIATVFGMDHPGYKEPWNYGADGLRNFKKYDSLRYTLLPYLYGSAWQQYKTGMPLMRALVLEYQEDKNVHEICDQYLLGDNLMICPVTTKGAQTRTVYLPEGGWYDFWTGKYYTGRQYLHVVTPLDTMPMFVKAGAVLPQQELIQYDGQKTIRQLQLQVYPGNGRFDWYEDDGKSLEYQKGDNAVTPITTTAAGNTLRLTIAAPVGNYQPSIDTYLVSWNGVGKPGTVTVNGQAFKAGTTSVGNDAGSYYYDAAARKITLLCPRAVSTPGSPLNMQIVLQ